VKARKDRRINAVFSLGACTEIARRLYRVYTACVRRFYGALFFLKRSYCYSTALSRRPLRTQDDSTASEIAEYGTVESLLKTTPELRPTL
jgi:hypothetical protein